MSRAAGEEALRVLLASDDPDHQETAAIAAWLDATPGLEPEPVRLEAVADAVEARAAAVVWIHGVRSLPLEALGDAAPDLLLRGRLLLTGAAAILPSAAGVDPAAPNDVGRSAWPDHPDDDGLPPLRGHATFHGHPLFDGLGATALTWAPAPGERYTALAYVRPARPGRGSVVAVERTRTRIDADRATIWEYDGSDGRTLCVGAFLPLHGADALLRRTTEALARNALRRARERPGPSPEGSVWLPADGAAFEDRTVAMPELPLLEEPVGSVEYRLRHAMAVAGDEAFRVAGRRALAAGGAAAGVTEVWVHPVRIAAEVGVRSGRGEGGVRTPVGVERQVRVGTERLLERVVVAREAPVCVMEWLSRTRTVEIEVGWTCDLRPADPYPAAAHGPLRWRRAGRGAVVAGRCEERAAFAFSEAPVSFEVLDASTGDRAAVEFRARLRLFPRVPVRLALVAAPGDAALRRALAAADRTAALTRARHGTSERLMTGHLGLEAPDPVPIAALEWAKQEIEDASAEAPAIGRSVLEGTSFPGAGGVRAALSSLAAGDHRTPRDVLAFLGRHQDVAGRVPAAVSTSGAARYDDPEATPLYLLLAARSLAWTGAVATLRGEWPRVLRAYEAALLEAGAEDPGGRGDPALLGCALLELADAAESIGERGIVAELRREGERRGGRRWSAEGAGSSPVLSVTRGLLGAEPDAPRGRLVLRPEPPLRWPRFAVSHLAVGGAAVSLDYRRTGQVHTFRLRQERGPSPLQVVLEPALPGRTLVGARVDGTVAELDARPRGDRLVVPLQLVLDDERVVELEADDGGENERRRH